MADSMLVNPDGEIYAVQVGDKTYGIAGADGVAEAQRAAAEAAREEAEAARALAEQGRAAAQQANDEAQADNDEAQARNNAQQAANNASAQGLTAVILDEGEYDESTLEPTVEGEVGKMYLVPMPQAQAVAAALPMRFALESQDDGTYVATQAEAADGDVYVEWLWINSSWERIGLSTATIDPVTTDQIDAVAAGSAPQGKQVLNLTGLSYLWSKIRGAFAALAHGHSASDITSGTLPVSRGGTNGTTAAAARTSLGAASQEDLDTVRDSLSRGLVFRGQINDVHNLRQMGIYSSSNAAHSPQAGYVTYVCILQNNDPSYPIIFGLSITGAIYNCWKNTSGSFSDWRRLDV